MEKRFPPSKKRLSKARREGNTPKSQYLTQVGVGLVVTTAAILVIGLAWVRGQLLLEYILTEGFSEPLVASGRCISEALKVVVVVLSFGAFASVVMDVWQIGLFFEPLLAVPRLDRLNPAAGFIKIVSAVREAPVILLRLFVLLAAFITFLYHLSLGVGSYLFAPWREQIRYLALQSGYAFTLGFVILALFALWDLRNRRRRWQSINGMSLDDLRQEHKEEEGDPHYRAMRRALHREFSFEDIVRKVRASRVIIVAPRQSK